MPPPAAAFSEAEHLRRRAHTLRQGLVNRLTEIRSADFPADAPKEVISLLLKILSELGHQIDKQQSTDVLSITCNLIAALGQFLEFLDNANTEQTPRGLVQILEDLVSILEPEATLLAWPQAKLNYSIIDVLPFLRRLCENVLPRSSVDSIFGPQQGPIKLISFPRIHRDDILVHSIFGHELGHPIADDFLAQEEQTSAFKVELKSATSKLDHEFAAEISKLPNQIEKTRYKQRLLSELLSVRKRALEELISDCVACFIFGPSALFASYDVLVPMGLDLAPSRPDYYPPSRMRLRIALDVLEDNGWLSTIESLSGSARVPPEIGGAVSGYIAHLRQLAADETDKRKIERDKLLKIAYSWVDSSLTSARAAAFSALRSVVYRDDVVSRELAELLERVYRGVPPNETGVFPAIRPANWRSAILAGWLYRICALKVVDGSTVQLDAQDLETIQKLTLKAVEYISLQDQHSRYLLGSGAS